MNKTTISIVIGSWGSYNECNERALGSTWIDLADYESYEEIKQELIKQGFKLKGIDEELFIQDIEGFDTSYGNWDNMHPRKLFDIIKESEILEDEYKFDKFEAFVEVRSFSEFQTLVESHGSNWDDNIYLYKGFTWFEFGEEHFNNCCYNIPNDLTYFFNYEDYGKYIGDYYAEEYSDGIIEIVR